MIEVEYCGGGHRTRLNNQLVSMGCPLATYIKEGGREEAGQVGCSRGGDLLGLLVQVVFGPPFSFLPRGERGKE